MYYLIILAAANVSKVFAKVHLPGLIFMVAEKTTVPIVARYKASWKRTKRRFLRNGNFVFAFFAGIAPRPFFYFRPVAQNLFSTPIFAVPKNSDAKI